MHTRVLSWRQNWPWHEVDHLSPSSAEAKNEESSTSTVPIWLRGMEREKWTFDSTAWYVLPTFQRTILHLSSKHKRVEKVPFQNVGTHVTDTVSKPKYTTMWIYETPKYQTISEIFVSKNQLKNKKSYHIFCRCPLSHNECGALPTMTHTIRSTDTITTAYTNIATAWCMKMCLKTSVGS